MNGMAAKRGLLFSVVFVLAYSTNLYAGTKHIGVLVFDGVLTSDITAPIEVFGAASAKSWFSDYEIVTIAVDNTSEVTTNEGLKLQVDAGLKDRPKVDVLIVPSSYEMEPILKNKELISYIKATARTAEWLASNCSGAFVLGEAGVLDDRKATTWAGGERELKASYPKVDVQFDTNYVVDGNVITSNGGLVSYQAALFLLSKLSSERKSKDIAETLQYERLKSGLGTVAQ